MTAAAAARSAAALTAVLCVAFMGAVCAAHDAHAPAAARRLLEDASPASVGRCTLALDINKTRVESAYYYIMVSALEATI